ncbi:outer membrane lipoprotein chaperone LolA [Endozoicomonadaceae bacterium StTr2]
MKLIKARLLKPLSLCLMLGLNAGLSLSVSAGETTAPVSEAAKQQQEAATQLSQRLQSIQSMAADFIQETVQTPGKAPQVTRGHMTVERPDRFRWDVKEPYPQLVIAGQGKVTVYDPDLEQAVIRKLDQSLHDTPALLLSGDTSGLSKSYQISLSVKDGIESYQLQPRSGDRLFEALVVNFKGKQLESMVLKDGLGAETRIRFSALQENNKPDPSLFQFVPPKGTDLIDETALKSKL